MKLFAKKPCRFNGREFFIGDEIPSEHVLDPMAQEKMGVIVVVGENSGSSTEGKPADSEEGGPLLPPSLTLEQEDITYSKGKLTRMAKAELLKIAEQKGVEATADMTNEAIAAMIIEKQGE